MPPCTNALLSAEPVGEQVSTRPEAMMMYTPKHNDQTAALGKYGVVTSTQNLRIPAVRPDAGLGELSALLQAQGRPAACPGHLARLLISSPSSSFSILRTSKPYVSSGPASNTTPGQVSLRGQHAGECMKSLFG